MHINDNQWDHFYNRRFCVGDRFFLCDNKILCEYDYEERMVFANLAYNSSNLAQMKQNNRGSNNGPTNGPSGPKVSTIFQHIKKEVQNTAKCFDQLHLWEIFFIYLGWLCTTWLNHSEFFFQADSTTFNIIALISERAHISQYRFFPHSFFDQPLAAWLAQAALRGKSCAEIPLLFPCYNVECQPGFKG